VPRLHLSGLAISAPPAEEHQQQCRRRARRPILVRQTCWISLNRSRFNTNLIFIFSFTKVRFNVFWLFFPTFTTQISDINVCVCRMSEWIYKRADTCAMLHEGSVSLQKRTKNGRKWSITGSYMRVDRAMTWQQAWAHCRSRNASSLLHITFYVPFLEQKVVQTLLTSCKLSRTTYDV